MTDGIISNKHVLLGCTNSSKQNRQMFTPQNVGKAHGEFYSRQCLKEGDVSMCLDLDQQNYS